MDTSKTTGERLAAIDALLGRQSETPADRLAEVSRDLTQLADVAARIINADPSTDDVFGTVMITVYADRATFDALPGRALAIRSTHPEGDPMVFDSKTFGHVYVYCRENCDPFAE